jgi:hypothetical protein
MCLIRPAHPSLTGWLVTAPWLGNRGMVGVDGVITPSSCFQWICCEDQHWEEENVLDSTGASIPLLRPSTSNFAGAWIAAPWLGNRGMVGVDGVITPSSCFQWICCRRTECDGRECA